MSDYLIFVACLCMLSRLDPVWLFATLWTVARQAPLSMGFSRQEYWSGLPCPPPGDLPDPWIKPLSLTLTALAGGFYTTNATWEKWLYILVSPLSLWNSPSELRPCLLDWSPQSICWIKKFSTFRLCIFSVDRSTGAYSVCVLWVNVWYGEVFSLWRFWQHYSIKRKRQVFIQPNIQSYAKRTSFLAKWKGLSYPNLIVLNNNLHKGLWRRNHILEKRKE